MTIRKRPAEGSTKAARNRAVDPTRKRDRRRLSSLGRRTRGSRLRTRLQVAAFSGRKACRSQARCSFNFAAGQIHGLQYYHQGRVRLDNTTDNTVRAAIEDNSDNYEVSLDWSDAGNGIIASSCTCSYSHQRRPCKHIWAAMLAADEQTGPRRRQTIAMRRGRGRNRRGLG